MLEPTTRKFYDIKQRIHIAARAASLLFIVHRGSCHRSAQVFGSSRAISQERLACDRDQDCALGHGTYSERSAGGIFGRPCRPGRRWRSGGFADKERKGPLCVRCAVE